LKINCDLGESENLELLEQQNQAIMPAIDLANIACGGHCGNIATMSLCITHCLQHKVSIGAHPSYPDCKNFGRTSMANSLSPLALKKTLTQQVQALLNCCQEKQITLSHIKPHGALYHDCQTNIKICQIICEVCSFFNLPLILSYPQNINKEIKQQLQNHQIIIWNETFADRKYQKNGSLCPRTTKKSVLTNQQDIGEQFYQIIKNKRVKVDNKWLNLISDTICFHSDNPASITFLSK
jgi:UPF0271 protein